MFRELEPFLRNRAVLLTVTHLGDDQIRVNVVPKKLKDGENEALTTPLSVTGTAGELDAELSKTLVDFVGAHLQLKNSLDSARDQMDAAAKAAQEEARQKAKNSGKSGKPQLPAPAIARTQEIDKPPEPPKATSPANFSLFDSPAAIAPVAAPSLSTGTQVSAVLEEDEDEADILAEMDASNPLEDDDLGEVA